MKPETGDAFYEDAGRQNPPAGPSPSPLTKGHSRSGQKGEEGSGVTWTQRCPRWPGRHRSRCDGCRRASPQTGSKSQAGHALASRAGPWGTQVSCLPTAHTSLAELGQQSCGQAASMPCPLKVAVPSRVACPAGRFTQNRQGPCVSRAVRDPDVLSLESPKNLQCWQLLKLKSCAANGVDQVQPEVPFTP